MTQLSWRRSLFTALLTSLFFIGCAHAADIEVPNLGDGGGGVVSTQQEDELGQLALKFYRSQLSTSNDPVLYSYLENLIADLARYSDLENKSFDLLVINNKTFNAFAAPGRIIGVHTGVFNIARSEDELASVLAHELAHLSQRHYARQIEQQKNATVPQIVGLLAGIVLAAAGGTDAGLAAISASQAAGIDQRLKFSRQYEEEADRVGMQTMVRAERNPEAVGSMFEGLLRANRFTRRPPEFLSTHPVTERRIADARSRSLKYEPRDYDDNLDFHLASARVRLFLGTPQEAVKRFRQEVDGESLSLEASRYGLVLALIRNNQVEQAHSELAILLQQRPDKLHYRLAKAQAYAQEKNYDSAIRLLEELWQQDPTNHPINIQLAEVLMESGEYARCKQLLDDYVRHSPKHQYAWYILAEVSGLAGDILAVHLARAEYFILVGVFGQAEEQLKNARKLAEGDRITTALIEQRLIDVRELIRAVRL